MGVGGSKENAVSIFDSKYQKERAELRKALIESFRNNPKYYSINEKIRLVRKILTERPHICATADREGAKAEEYAPTNIEAAYHELDRLIAIYETHTILRSAACRIGQIACPLGHYAGYMDSFKELGTKKKPALCNICDKTVKDGYHCGYCMYNLCVPCSTIYCCNGHALKLWTHPESTHHCVVCNKEPITSGYRCVQCPEDYNICDYCTWKDGRKIVQAVILARIADDIAYLEAHQEESETAFRTIQSHSVKVSNNSYATTKHLHDFSVEVKKIKEIAVAEVRQTRITKAIIALREELVKGLEFSRTAYTESLVIENYTAEELERLRELKQYSDEWKSVSKRELQPVACPLGHSCLPYDSAPPVYCLPVGSPPLSKDVVDNPPKTLLAYVQPISRGGKVIENPATVCKVCDRLAAPKGAHCMFCDYSLCTICAIIYCHKGHQMSLWTEPAAMEYCFLCHRTDVVSGYRCKTCNINLCDLCTTKDGRNRIRTDWEKEMGNLVGFMKKNRRQSDVANFYQWRHANHVVSVGLLVDYVQELRTAKSQASKQIEQKPIIDKIKQIRQEICRHPELCATATRELSRNDAFVFPSKKKAAKELYRLAGVLREMLNAQAPERRLVSGVACPLAHAMVKLNLSRSFLPPLGGTRGEMRRRPLAGTGEIQSSQQSSMLLLEAGGGIDLELGDSIELQGGIGQGQGEEEEMITPKGESKQLHTLPPISPSHEKEERLLKPLKDKAEEQRVFLEQSMNSLVTDFPGSPSFKPDQILCSVCATDEMDDGRVCSICEYFLCGDCCVVYCKQGHRCKIWTLHDAHCLNCDVCQKQPLTSGYRCLTCNEDICDMCTTKDSRNAFLLWPKRELSKLLQTLERMGGESRKARDFVQEMKDREEQAQKRILLAGGEGGPGGYMSNMSKLCRLLERAREVKIEAEDEIRKKIEGKKAQKFGAYHAREML